MYVLKIKNQASISPFGPHENSVFIEHTIEHLRYHLADVPPQPNSQTNNCKRPSNPPMFFLHDIYQTFRDLRPCYSSIQWRNFVVCLSLHSSIEWTIRPPAHNQPKILFILKPVSHIKHWYPFNPIKYNVGIFITAMNINSRSRPG